MFLATTACEEFWDKSQEILFLGEWCKLYNKREDLKLLSHSTFDFYWIDRKRIDEAYLYCNELYERILIHISKELNIIHNINQSTYFYRTILGNWLIRFIHQYYDKYIHLKGVKEKYNNIETYILSEKDYYIPFNAEDYIAKQYQDDRYNLQFYSDIIKYLSLGNIEKTLKNKIIENNNFIYNEGLKSKFYNIFYKALNLITKFKKKKIILVNPYFKYNNISNIFKILFHSSFSCIFDDFKYRISITKTVDTKLRSNIKIQNSQDDFEQLVLNNIFKHIPTIFLENFHEFKDNVQKLNIEKNRFYYTANALHSNDIFKFFIAENDSAKLLVHQHGGAYGLDKSLANEDYERSLSFIYYTWGWSAYKCKKLSFPRHNMNDRVSSNNNILFVMNDTSRYVYDIHFQAFSSNLTTEYLNMTKNFFHKVDRSNLLVRLKSSSNKTFLKSRLKDEFKDLNFDDSLKSFDEQLQGCRIFVSDHLTTTWLESLSLNKPTVVFSSLRYSYFREDAMNIMKKLEDVGILFFDSEKAADHINKIYDNVDDWWNNEKLQLVKNEFVSIYANSNDNWTLEWCKEFKEVLNSF